MYDEIHDNGDELYDSYKLTRGDVIQIFKSSKQNPMNKFKNGTKGKIELFYEDGILLETEKGELIRVYEPYNFRVL